MAQTKTDADLSVYTKQVVKEEVKAEFAKLDLTRVGYELIQGKTTTLENAMENVGGRTAKKVCGEGALQELRPYYPYIVAGGLGLVGLFLYKKFDK